MMKIGEKILWLRVKRYVARHKPLLVGVTGSFGKTMTKDAIAKALSRHHRVRASRESYNTPIGVALSILGVERARSRFGWVRLLASSRFRELAEDPEPDVLVLELGADRPGDIDFFARELPFRVGVITGVGSAHLEYFVEKENVAHEKMSLALSLSREGIAVLNFDDPLVREMASHITRARVVSYGTREDADVRLVRAHRLGVKGFAVEIDSAGVRIEGTVPHIAARHQLMSIMAALAVAHALGLDVQKAFGRVRELTSPPGRMQVLPGKGGAIILDDTYNAPPEAVVAALNTLGSMQGKRKIAILGDMLELGAHAIAWHKDVGRQVAAIADVFVGVGPTMKHAQASALTSGEKIDCHHFDDSRDAGTWLAPFLKEGDIVLVKGSRAMRMEYVVQRLT